MKLTPDLLASSPSYINAIKDRELDLRGLKIPLIENLGVTKDQHDCIDFTDNDIRYLGNLPRSKRLTTLLLADNAITRIDAKLGESVPNLTTLILTGNALQNLTDLEPLSQLSRLEYISLMDTPVSRKKHYRAWIIWKCPSVRIFDFKKVKDAERAEAKKLFTTADGSLTEVAESIQATRTNTFEPGAALNNGQESALGALTSEERARIQQAIKSAKSLDEVNRLENLLRMGHMPESVKAAPSKKRKAAETIEEDE